MHIHEKYMQRCLELALKGKNSVAPNPLVGSILVYENRIIGEGWHEQYGRAHAEVNCINSVEKADRKYISSATLFVSLEPCSFHGNTPACTDFIIKNQIPKVIIGCLDNHPKVSGQGVLQLEKAGIEVIYSVLEPECNKMNRRAFTFQSLKRPYIVLKWAESNDGFIAPIDGRRMQLSNTTSQKLVHKMRTEESAILVGFQTAINDNPNLNNRFWKSGKQLVRIVLDYKNQLPIELKLFHGEQKTIIFNFFKQETVDTNEWIKINKNESLLHQILKKLQEKGISSLIVEGGTKTLQSFINEDLWDEAIVFKTAPYLGNGIKAPQLLNAKPIDNFNLGNDIVNLLVHERNHFYIQDH